MSETNQERLNRKSFISTFLVGFMYASIVEIQDALAQGDAKTALSKCNDVKKYAEQKINEHFYGDDYDADRERSQRQTQHASGNGKAAE